MCNMANDIVVSRYSLKKMYDELLVEINKDKYNAVYAWFDWNPILLNNNIEESIYFSQERSYISYTEHLFSLEEDVIVNENKAGSKYIITFYEDCNERFFKTDDVKKIMKKIIDFKKLEEIENEDGEIYNISLKELLNKNIILNKDKFLKIYFKTHNICLLKDLNLKNINISKFIYLYYEMIFNDLSSHDVKYLDDVKEDKNVGEYI